MNPVTDDPGSLSRLHDIVVGPPTPWWPLAPAWYLLAALLLTGLCLTFAWIAVYWRSTRYRRAGLAELQLIERSRSHESAALIDLAELIKRISLVAYPRHRVASLTGADWLQFLDQTIGTADFSAGPGQQIAHVYDRSPTSPTPELYQLVRYWIRRHRRDCGC